MLGLFSFSPSFLSSFSPLRENFLAPILRSKQVHVVLHQPEIPDNAGNIGRTCVAVGAKLWLVRPLGFRLDDRHLRRAGLDYWQHLDWEAVDDWRRSAAACPTGLIWFFSKTAAPATARPDLRRATCWSSAASRRACRVRCWRPPPTAACGSPWTPTPAALTWRSAWPWWPTDAAAVRVERRPGRMIF